MHDDEKLAGHRTVTPHSVATFGCLTGDYARIHFDHHLGEAVGGGFAHGLLSASWALGAMTLHFPERVGCGDAGAFVSSFETRFHQVVHFGDTLAVRCDNAAEEAGVPAGARRTAFQVCNQEGLVATSGLVTTAHQLPDRNGRRVLPWPREAGERPAAMGPLGAEDLLEHAPRGSSPVRTVTEADVVNFMNFTGELNPLFLDAESARRGLFGARIAPPMLCFCLGFSAWLRVFLRLPLGGRESSAGHLGDRWEFVAPVFIGDTLEVRYQQVSVRRTRSQPTRGIATFGLQLTNQREEVVLQGEVDMMLEMRSARE